MSSFIIFHSSSSIATVMPRTNHKSRVSHLRRSFIALKVEYLEPQSAQFSTLHQFLIRANSHLPALPGGHQRVCFARSFQRKSVSNDICRVKIPPHQPLHQFFHEPGRRNPRPIHRLLIVNHVRRWIDFDRSAFPEKDDLPPLARSANRRCPRRVVCRAVHCPLHAESTSKFFHLGHIVRARGKNCVAQFQVDSNLHSLGHHIDTDDLVGAQLAAKRASSQAHRPKPSNEHSVIAVDSDLFQALIHCAESARYLGAIGEREFIGKSDQVLLLGNHILGHSTVALPSVCSAILFAGTRNHVPAPAVVAHAAAGDVVHNHTIARFETATALALSHDLSAWLVPRDHSLVAFRPLAQMLVIDAANIRPANCRSLDPKQNFPMTRLRHRYRAHFDRRVPRQKRRSHRLFHLLSPIPMSICASVSKLELSSWAYSLRVELGPNELTAFAHKRWVPHPWRSTIATRVGCPKTQSARP